MLIYIRPIYVHNTLAYYFMSIDRYILKSVMNNPILLSVLYYVSYDIIHFDKSKIFIFCNMRVKQNINPFTYHHQNEKMT